MNPWVGVQPRMVVDMETVASRLTWRDARTWIESPKPSPSCKRWGGQGRFGTRMPGRPAVLKLRQRTG
jgi:hypothetical protein